jgi:DNA-directed RNA polymerase subunit RPC12/RpoP
MLYLRDRTACAERLEEVDMSMKTFVCRDCGSEMSAEENAMDPECCGSRMIARMTDPLPHSMTAETARFGDEDDATDEA